MFGHNEVVGQRFFREVPEAQAGKLLVTSVFRTIQGEGPHAGCPAVFVRLAKCQLSCHFCDTYFDSGDWLDFEELLAQMVAARGEGAAPSDLAVITGGEPTLQASLGGFIEYLPRRIFTRAQVESNGLLEARVPPGTCVVVSPKCAERGGRVTHYLIPSQAALRRADCLKFVISGDLGSPYASVPAWALEWRRRTGREIYMSPMAEYLRTPGTTRALYDARRAPSMAERVAAEAVSFWESGLLDMGKCRRNYEHAARYVLEHGLRLTVQMQLFASLP